METSVRSTMYSLSGIDPLLYSLQDEIILPLKALRYGPTTKVERDDQGQGKPAPKFILFTGARGSGRTAVTSVIVNELRKGRLTKSADTFYNQRNVRYLTFDRYNGDPDLIDRLRGVFADARNPNPVDGRDFTLLLFPDFQFYCPRDWGTVENPPRRRIRRLTSNVNYINALIEELDGTPPGRILLVGHASEAEDLDRAVAAKLDYAYDIPCPGVDSRRKLIVHFFDEFNAQFRSDTKLLIRATKECSAGEIRELVYDGVQEAKFRIQRARDLALAQGAVPVPAATNGDNQLVVTNDDFRRFMDLSDNEDNAGGQNAQAPVIGPQYHPQHDLEDDEEDDFWDEEELQVQQVIIPIPPPPQQVVQIEELPVIPVDRAPAVFGLPDQDPDLQVEQQLPGDPPQNQVAEPEDPLLEDDGDDNDDLAISDSSSSGGDSDIEIIDHDNANGNDMEVGNEEDDNDDDDGDENMGAD